MTLPEKAIILTDLNDAIIGYEEKSERIIYSKRKIIEQLCNNMSIEDAEEHYYFNIERAYMGEHTPIYCNDDEV